MNVTDKNWQLSATNRYSSSQSTRSDSRLNSDSKTNSSSGTDSDSAFKMSSSGPKNTVGELAAMLARAETLMDVHDVYSKAMRALADLKMGALASEGKDAKKYAQQIKRMEKLIKRIQKKLKQLSKEECLREQAEKAAKKAELEREQQLRQELQAKKKKRRREEREYALKELAADQKSSLNDTVSSMLSASGPSTDISSLTGTGSDVMSALGDFSGMNMGSLDIMV